MRVWVVAALLPSPSPKIKVSLVRFVNGTPMLNGGDGLWESGLIGGGVKKCDWWKERGISLSPSTIPSSDNLTKETMEENTFPVESKMKGWSGWEGEDSLGKERELLFGDGLSVGYHWSHFLISVHIQTISPDFLDLIKSRLAHNRKVASTIKVCLSEALLKME
jgi:hypothetical protein